MNGRYMLAPPVTFQDFFDDYPNEHSQSDSICLNNSDELVRQQDMITLNDEYVSSFSLPIQPYSFSSNLYKVGALSIPRNILYTSRGSSTKTKDSISYHMPHWNQFSFNPKQQKEFIVRYFPDRLGLYKSFSYEEERNNLFIYLWMYLNGGIYVDSDYELMKSLEPILDSMSSKDLYFTLDDDRYISPKFMASQPFCEFWMEVIALMDKRKHHKYNRVREQIDRNTGRYLITDVLDESLRQPNSYKYEIIPRAKLDPYSSCDKVFTQDSCLRPSNRTQDFVTSMSCSTGSTNEVIYITGAIILVIAIMIIIALITR